MSVQTLASSPATCPAIAYVDHLRALAVAGTAVKPSAEVVRTVLAKAGLADVIARVLSGPSVTYVHLVPGTDRIAVVRLLEPLWTEETAYGALPRVRKGTDVVTIQRAGWENTRPVGSEVPRPQAVAYGMTEDQLFEVADVIDRVLATQPAGMFWTIAELAAGLRLQDEVKATAATLAWMVEQGFVARFQPRSTGRVLFLRQHVAA